MKRILLVCFIVTVAVVSSFVYLNSANHTSKSPILGFSEIASCSQICWYGIKPGITTRNEAWGILNKLFQERKIPYFMEESHSFWIDYSSDSSHLLQYEHVNILLDKNDRVDQISGIVNGFFLKDLVELFGNPEVIFVKQGELDLETPCWKEEPRHTQFGATTYILYPNIGMIFIIEPQTIPALCPETEVSSFLYHLPMHKNDLSELYVGITGVSKTSDEFLTPWPGFNPPASEPRSGYIPEPFWCHSAKIFLGNRLSDVCSSVEYNH